MPLISTYDLCKFYGKGDMEVCALQDINIDIDRGEFVAIAGASGSGKSTLLHMLGAVDYPTSGDVFIGKHNITKLNEDTRAKFRRQRIGFIFQSYNLIPVLTAEENITVPSKLDGDIPDKEYLEELLDMLKLTERRNFLPHQMSGGQQQRVAIGRALINRPAIVLADEPTGNLDSKNSKEVMNFLKYAVRQYRQTLVMITHDPSVARQADSIIEIRDGKVVGGADA